MSKTLWNGKRAANAAQGVWIGRHYSAKTLGRRAGVSPKNPDQPELSGYQHASAKTSCWQMGNASKALEMYRILT